MAKKKSPSKKKKAKKRRPVSKRSKGLRKWHFVLLGIVVILAYIPVFQAEFVDIDDVKLILNKGNLFLNKPFHVFNLNLFSPHYKPLVYFSWMLEYNLFRDNPLPYHINNLILHLLNTFLIFFLTRSLAGRFQLTKSNTAHIAFWTALLFGLHPLHVESVAWAVERKDVLYTFFFLISLLLYFRYLGTKKYLPLAASVVAYLFSVFSKSPGVMLLPILFLMDYFYQRKRTVGLLVEKTGHIAVLFIALYLFGFFSPGTSEGEIGNLFSEEKLSLAENVVHHPTFYTKFLLIGMKTWLWYLHTWLPFNNALAYPQKEFVEFFGMMIHALPVLLLIAVGLLVYLRQRKPFFVFTHLFFLVALFPAIIRSSPGVGIFLSDRYVYLASYGLLFYIAASILNARDSKWLNQGVRTAILVAIAVIYAIMTFLGARTWKNTETLWSNVIKKYPQVSYAWVNRGSYYRDQGQYERGLRDLNKAIDIEDSANAFIQRGMIYRQMGRPADALQDYNRALQKEPDNQQALINRGNSYLDLQQFPAAIEDYNAYLEEHGSSVRALTNRAAALASSGRFNEALADLNKAEQLDPDYKDLYLNRAILYFNTGNYQEAIRNYDAFIRLNPGDDQSYYDKGIIYQRMNQHQNAIQSFNQAISLNPNVKNYYLSRAASHDALGNTSQAQNDRSAASRF